MAQLNPHSLCHSSHRKTTWKPPPNLSVVVVGQHVSSGTGWFQPVLLEIHTSSWKWNNSLLQLGPGDTIPPPPKKIKSKYQLFRCHLQDVPLLRNDGQTDIWSSYIRFSSGSFWLYPLQLWLKSRSIPDTALKIYCEGKIFVHFSAAHPGTQSPTLQANPIPHSIIGRWAATAFHRSQHRMLWRTEENISRKKVWTWAVATHTSVSMLSKRSQLL